MSSCLFSTKPSRISKVICAVENGITFIPYYSDVMCNKSGTTKLNKFKTALRNGREVNLRGNKVKFQYYEFSSDYVGPSLQKYEINKLAVNTFILFQ
jgi:hypothetical protein